MNQDNGTLVTGEMLKRLQEMGIDIGYREVPETLQAAAARLLGAKEIVDLSEETKAVFTDEAKFEAEKRAVLAERELWQKK